MRGSFAVCVVFGMFGVLFVVYLRIAVLGEGGGGGGGVIVVRLCWWVVGGLGAAGGR